MYGTLVAAAGLALSDMTEGGCGYGIRWCMVYADEVVYGWHLLFVRSAAAAAAAAFRLALERDLTCLHSRRATNPRRKTRGGGKWKDNRSIVVGRLCYNNAVRRNSSRSSRAGCSASNINRSRSRSSIIPRRHDAIKG